MSCSRLKSPKGRDFLQLPTDRPKKKVNFTASLSDEKLQAACHLSNAIYFAQSSLHWVEGASRPPLWTQHSNQHTAGTKKTIDHGDMLLLGQRYIPQSSFLRYNPGPAPGPWTNSFVVCSLQVPLRGLGVLCAL